MQGATEKCLHRFLLRRLLAFLGAARLEIDAAISFMGLNVGKHLDEAANMSKGEGPSDYCEFWPRHELDQGSRKRNE